MLALTRRSWSKVTSPTPGARSSTALRACYGRLGADAPRPGNDAIRPADGASGVRIRLRSGVAARHDDAGGVGGVQPFARAWFDERLPGPPTRCSCSRTIRASTRIRTTARRPPPRGAARHRPARTSPATSAAPTATTWCDPRAGALRRGGLHQDYPGVAEYRAYEGYTQVMPRAAAPAARGGRARTHHIQGIYRTVLGTIDDRCFTQLFWPARDTWKSVVLSVLGANNSTESSGGRQGEAEAGVRLRSTRLSEGSLSPPLARHRSRAAARRSPTGRRSPCTGRCVG